MIDLKNVNSYFETDDEIKIVMNNFFSIYENITILNSQGFKLIKVDALDYYFQGPKMLTIHINLPNPALAIRMPDYSDSMVNLVSSIQKYYGRNSKYSSIKDLDELLNSYKPEHIMLLILDGLAPYVLNKVLKSNQFLKKYLLRDMSAVFPPTTACAIPVSTSGKLAYETGWLGWSNYFKDIDTSLVLFTGRDYETNLSTGINVREKYLPYDDFFKGLGVNSYDLEPSFKKDGFYSFKELLKAFLNITKKNDKSFTYAYWDEPDALMHEYGVFSKEVSSEINRLSSELSQLARNVDDDTMIIVTADHGHQDVNPIPLYEFKNLYDMLERTPSNESRALCLKVKSGYLDKFRELFNFYFSSLYDLYSKDEFIEKGFLGVPDGKINPYLDEFLGDYIAIAKGAFNFIYYDFNDSFYFKSHHAGLTENEMLTPLIVYSKRKSS